ncbi:Tfp pilus assembly protein PilF [Rhizobiales bacterium GAS191]|nr:Tfp pilus assembly protein PilF [Rhizobiales bacterium GAS191]
MTNAQKPAGAAEQQMRARHGKALSLAQAYETAVALHRQGAARDADRMYRAVLRVAPHHVGALHHLGVLCTQLGRTGEAVRLLEQAIAIEPKSAGPYSDLGIALVASGRSDEAVAQYEIAIALDPGNVEAHNNLGTVLLQRKLPEQAIAHFQQALAARPNAAGVHINLGNALAALNRFDQAIAHYEAALEISPSSARAHKNLGLALVALNRSDEAIAQYEKAMALKPDDADAYRNIAHLLVKLGRHDTAVAHFQTALAIAPNDAEMEIDLGNALAILGRHTEAIVRYSKALAIRPNFAEAHNNLGNSLAALDRHEDAISHYRTAIASAPQLVEAHNNLGSSLESLERAEEAISCYETALSVHPQDARIHHRLGYMLRMAGKLEDSRVAFEKAVALAPARADFYRGLVESRKFTSGDPLLATMEELARDPSRLPPDWHIELQFALAKVYGDLDQHEKAFGHLIRGNMLKRQQIVYDEAETLGLFRRIAAVFSPDLLRDLRGYGDPSDVPVFIIGMPRSGTTLVEQMLASHPKVFGAGEIMELNKAAAGLGGSEAGGQRFPEGIASVTPMQLRKLAARYLGSLRAKAPSAERITDKALANFYFAGLIHLALPNARIIHLRRDPVDTCLSAFSKLFGSPQPHTYDLGELGRYYRGYDALMAHWRRVLLDGVMLEVQYEELVANFEPQARRIIAHIGLEWADRCLAFHETQRTVRTASATQVRQPIYRDAVGRSRPYAAMLAPLLEALGKEGM